MDSADGDGNITVSEISLRTKWWLQWTRMAGGGAMTPSDSGTASDTPHILWPSDRTNERCGTRINSRDVRWRHREMNEALSDLDDAGHTGDVSIRCHDATDRADRGRGLHAMAVVTSVPVDGAKLEADALLSLARTNRRLSPYRRM